MREAQGVARTMGLAGATGVGVGAIVGGGILALAGVAFAATGPGAMVAFALNGVIAMLTALSFAEMSAAFPESGGTYTFAKKVLNVRLAFGIGWVVWSASLVAAVLYGLGFSSFAMLAVQELVGQLTGEVPTWLTSRWCATGLAILATSWGTWGLLKRGGGGGQWMNVTKSAVFAVVIAAGLWAVTRAGGGEIGAHLTPFFPEGSAGMFRAMGFTFIALQGFDLIAAVAGEIKNPGRNIPRAMLGSLGIALGIYIPLLFVVAAAGVGPGESIGDLARAQPESVVAIASRRFLGEFGYWLVVVAGILSMLSALNANLFAASRVGFAMGRDRTLAPSMGEVDAATGRPRRSVLVVAGIVIVTLVLVPDVATAGAAASLVFLITFALAHYISILIRNRLDASALPFRVPFYPLVPIAGGTACMGLAFFQGASVPLAGAVAVMWLTAGAGLYAFRFAGRAQSLDAFAEGADPLLMKYRGRSPLVLLPVHDSESAVSLVAVANALCPPHIGRVLLLSSVQPPEIWKPGELPEELQNMTRVLGEAVNESFVGGLAPEAMLTVSSNHWSEIRRVARLHRCETLLLGFRNTLDKTREPGFDDLVTDVPSDIVLLRTPPGWKYLDTRRVLVPLGGRGMHSPLRARMLGSLRREVELETTYLRLLDGSATESEIRQAERHVRMRADDEMNGAARAGVERCAHPAEEIIARSKDFDLIILGLQQSAERRRTVSDFALRIAAGTECAVMVIGQKQDSSALRLTDRVLTGTRKARDRRP